MPRRVSKTDAPTPATDPDDAALFREAVGTVRRLRSDAVERRVPPPAPIPRQTLADDRDAVRESLYGPLGDAEWSEPLQYASAGTSPELLRRLGRGEFSVGDELDLHHMNVTGAKAAIARFLAESRKTGRLCVRIVHGKGLRSGAEGPVLKRLTDQVLRQRGDVLAFRSAPQRDGGTGAVLVLLRKP